MTFATLQKQKKNERGNGQNFISFSGINQDEINTVDYSFPGNLDKKFRDFGTCQGSQQIS